MLAALLVGTAGAVLAPQLARGGGGKTPLTMPPDLPGTFVTRDAQGVTLTGALSQSKLLQGGDGVIYVDLTIDTPATVLPTSVPRASDIVVVLDRSGSMAAENRLPYAKEAVRSLMGRLQESDRLALITFDSSATVNTPLVPMTEAVREQLYRQLEGIRPGASTNISDGLLKARALFEGRAAERSRRVILLSDGEANMGIVDPKALGQIAASFSKHGAVLSTIGMGLGFNETLLASLADYGMGNYSYLEHLATLGSILQKDLHDARQVFASASSLELTLREGVTVSDIGGYPMERSAPPGTVRATTGQLLAAAQKRFVMTLQVPTDHTGEWPLGTITLHYTTTHGAGNIALPQESLRVAVLESARRDEAIASIDKTLYQRLWQTNNLGRLQKEFSNWLRSGDRGKAEEAITQYRQTLQKQEAAAGVVLSSPRVVDTLSAMEHELQDAFSGPPAAQDEKRNRAAKAQHQKSVSGQRSY
jgi:Ca-activated chloride channel family protein